MADEVRKLAVESSNSIQQVKQIVKTILGLMQDSVEKMDNGRRAVEEGWATISAAVKAFTQIAENIGTTVAQVGKVSSLTQTMAGGAQQIAAATEEQSAAMYEISLSAQKLAESSAKLQENLSHFKIKKKRRRKSRGMSPLPYFFLLLVPGVTYSSTII
ncbi:MAG: methyl-accepting chemotaxis protein [Eubacteriales bacterium]|nr:methyl-accepting chemotaxis protein [Eubacteriales bacterium]